MFATYFSVPVLTGVAAIGAVSLFVLSMRGKRRVHMIKDSLSGIDLTGKTVIVTGANTGIGYWTAKDMASRNARVILACRNQDKGNAARQEIISATGNGNVLVQVLDLFDFDSVRDFASIILQTEPRLDILVNNAGVYSYGIPDRHSDHGLDMTLAVNHFGPYLLTRLLLELLLKSGPSRVINVSSGANSAAKDGIDFDNLHKERPLSHFAAYAQSKLANILFTRELAHRLATRDSDVTAYSVHPGMVSTNIWQKLSSPVRWLIRIIFFFHMKTSEDGALTVIHAAISEELGKKESGSYYADCALANDQVNPLADDKELTRKLWTVSASITGVDDLF